MYNKSINNPVLFKHKYMYVKIYKVPIQRRVNILMSDYVHM